MEERKDEAKSGYFEYQEDKAILEANLASQRDVKHYFSMDQRRDCSVIPADPDGDCGFTGTRRVLEVMGREEIASKITRRQFIELVNLKLREGDETIQSLIRDVFETDRVPEGHDEQRVRQWSAVFKSKGYWMSTPHFALLSKVYNIEFRFYCLNEENSFIPEMGNENCYCGENLEKKVMINLAHISMTPRDGNETLNHFDGLILDPTDEQRERIRLLREESQPKERSSSVVKLAVEERQRELVLLAERGQNFLSQGDIETARKVYVELLRLSHESDQIHYESQVLGYEGLGKVYERNEKWIDAIAIYHFALGVMDDAKTTKYFEERVSIYQDRLIKSIEQCETMFLKYITGKNIFAKAYKHYQQHQASLKQIAEEARKLLRKNREIKEALQSKRAEEEGRISYLTREQKLLEETYVSVEQIHRKISQQLRDFVKTLINESMKQLKLWREPLDEKDYAVICFGSLARDEATPYSDLEFGVLLADGKGTKENKEYFRVLTKLLNIKVINLHETLPRMQYIEELVDLGIAGIYSKGPVKAGFSFDGNKIGARKTPLGNREYSDVPDEKKYELIQTPQKLAEYHNEDWYEKDKHISSVLLTTSLMMGNHDLLTQYEDAVDSILNTEMVVKKEGTQIREPVTMTIRQRRALHYLHENVEEFQFRGGRFEKEGHYFDAKYHLYRLPNMWIDSLSMYFKGKEKSLWRRLKELFGEKKLVGQNENGLQNLTVAVSAVLAVRLNAYLLSQERDNYVIDLDASGKNDNSKWVSQHLGIQEVALINIYRVFIPLQWAIEDFINNKNTCELSKSNFYEGSSFIEGKYYYLLMKYDEALTAYKSAKATMIREHGHKHISLAEISNNLGIAYQAQGQYKQALSEYQQALAITMRVYSFEHISVKATWNNIGVVYDYLDQYENALIAYEKAKTIITYIHGPEHISMVDLWNNIGVVYQKQGHYEKALIAYKKAKAIIKRIYGSEHISMVDMWNNIGVVYQIQGRYIKASSAHKKAKEITIRVHGSDHISVSETLNNMGSIYRDQGYYKEALFEYEQAKAIRMRVHGPEHISIAEILNNIGIVYREQNQYEKALCAYEESIAIRIRVHGPEHISIAETLNNIGVVYRGKGQYEKALSVYEQVISITMQVLGPAHVSIVETLNNIGFLYQKLGQYQQALSAYENAKSIKIEVNCAEDISVAVIWRNLGDTYIELKDFKLARGAYQHAMKIYSHHQHTDLEIVQFQLKLSYVREGNQFLLEGNKFAAVACYKKSGFPFDFSSTHTHLDFANLSYTNNRVPEIIEHYRIIVLLDPTNGSVHHNLACMYHCRAQLQRVIHHVDEYIINLYQADEYFQEAIRLDRHVGVLTEYGQFMLTNLTQLEFFNLQKVIDVLNQARLLNQRDKILEYKIMDRYSVDTVLQKMIDKHRNISFPAYLLANYLLIKSYLLNHQKEEARMVLEEFEKAIASELIENAVNLQQWKSIMQGLSNDIDNEIQKRLVIYINCCEELLKQAKFLLVTPIKGWDKEQAEKFNETQDPSSLLKSPGPRGFFVRKSATHQDHQLLIEELKGLFDKGRLLEDGNTHIIIFISFDDAVRCQEILFKLGITDTESSKQVREINVIEDNRSNLCEFAIRLTQEEYQIIAGNSVKHDVFG